MGILERDRWACVAPCVNIQARQKAIAISHKLRMEYAFQTLRFRRFREEDSAETRSAGTASDAVELSPFPVFNSPCRQNEVFGPIVGLLATGGSGTTTENPNCAHDGWYELALRQSVKVFPIQILC